MSVARINRHRRRNRFLRARRAVGEVNRRAALGTIKGNRSAMFRLGAIGDTVARTELGMEIRWTDLFRPQPGGVEGGRARV